MKRLRTKAILALLVVICTLLSCDDQSSKRGESERVLLCYMLVPSNLVSQFENNITAIKSGYKGEGDIIILND